MKKLLSLLWACIIIFSSPFISKSKVDVILKEDDVVFLGDCGVGKYDIIKDIYNKHPSRNNFTNSFNDAYEIDIADSQGNVHTINLIDTAGQESFIQSIIPNIIRHSKVAVIVCSYNDLDSLNHIVDWSNLVRDYNNACQIIIVANNVGIEFNAADVMNKGTQVNASIVYTDISCGMDQLKQGIADKCTMYDQIVTANMAAAGAVNLNNAPATNDAKCC